MIDNQFVKINSYTRTGAKMGKVKGVVWHYTASPGAPAQNIRNYFNGTCINIKRHAGAHIAVDDNEIIGMIPLNEVAYHAHDRNRCYPSELKPNANLNTIGVEMCVDRNGILTDATFENAVKVGVYLCKQFGFDPMKNFYMHYDVTGKNCPAMWVSKPSEFERFKQEVKERLNPKPEPQVSKQEIIEEVKQIMRDINVVSEEAKKDWEEAKANGYFDGTRPGAEMTREEASIVVNRLRHNFKKLFTNVDQRISNLEKLIEELNK
jgi:N-acetylmuramoyl-L-alanine amidase